MCFFRRALFNQLISFSKTEFMTIQFSNNPGISVRICADLYRFAGSAQHGKGVLFQCFGTMRLSPPFFGFVRLFFQNFSFLKGSSSNFYYFYNKLDFQKAQRIPFYNFKNFALFDPWIQHRLLTFQFVGTPSSAITSCSLFSTESTSNCPLVCFQQ